MGNRTAWLSRWKSRPWRAAACLLALAGAIACGTSVRQSTLPPQAPAVHEYGPSCGASTTSVIAYIEERVRESSSVGPVEERPDTSAIKTGAGLNIIKGVKIDRVANGVRVTYVNGERNLNTHQTSITESVGVFKVTFSAEGGRSRVTVTPPSVLEHSVATSKYFVNIGPLLDDEEAAAEFARIRNGLALGALC